MQIGDIAVSWLLEDGSVAGPVLHHIDNYHGVLPVVGDVVAVNCGDEIDAVNVVERYLADVNGRVTWHLVFSPVTLPPGRTEMLLRELPDADLPEFRATVAIRRVNRSNKGI